LLRHATLGNYPAIADRPGPNWHCLSIAAHLGRNEERLSTRAGLEIQDGRPSVDHCIPRRSGRHCSPGGYERTPTRVRPHVDLSREHPVPRRCVHLGDPALMVKSRRCLAG